MELLLPAFFVIGTFFGSAVITFVIGGMIAMFCGTLSNHKSLAENLATTFIWAWLVSLVVTVVVGYGHYQRFESDRIGTVTAETMVGVDE